MKLNLLPTYVSKGAATKTATVISVVLFLGSVAFAIGISVTSSKTLAHNKQAVEDMKPRADAVVQTAAHADDIIQQANQIIKDSTLASAMIAHNADYPRFYDTFLKYIPPFFRLTSISVTPIDDKSATVQMQGVLKTYQQYADLMLALMRYPRAVSIARTGFQSVDLTVPPLSPTDQLGQPLRPGQSPIPSDPLDRLNYYIAQGRTEGYQGTGGFGSGVQGTRLAGPDYSLINVTMVVQDKLETPNPRATISSSTSSASAAGSGSSFGAGFPGGGPPMGGGMPPMGPMGPTGGAPGAPATGGAGGGRAED